MDDEMKCGEVACDYCHVPWYFTKYMRLREEMEKQSELIQREWLSPVEAIALRSQLADVEKRRRVAEKHLKYSWNERLFVAKTVEMA